MSSGYGKTYNNASISQCLNELAGWKKFILKYKTPLYYLSSSIGNVLMENLLLNEHRDVAAAASLFGIPFLNGNPHIQIPTLYILGENDPNVPYYQRSQMLAAVPSSELVQIKSYADEGHWFRKTSNLEDAVYRIIEQFRSH